ncbi:hypothetical protein G7Z17_g1323 [Cylindrodendrum hubeiense]|uniref:Uncharacterized protein n=1 Tax=Cylindrodendrum hubeiense TaxID=595255 RepID=A0A9P5HJV1_9HYPO|nr:hypothetical protein G7Z17_g1323 [Cylindrodendrum hubeiense]
MLQLGAMDRCKAFFHRFLVLLLGAALLSQLALLPARASGFSINSIAEAASADATHGSLLERDSLLPRVERVERHFTDAGSHKIFARALDERLVREGARFICSLNSRDYPPASTWTNVASIQGYVSGWNIVAINQINAEAINTIAPWLNANGLSSALGDYTTVQTRSDQRIPGTSGVPTNAVMKNIYNLAEGTIIVEDVLNPNLAPVIGWSNFLKTMAIFGVAAEDAETMAPLLDIDIPPRDAAGYSMPPLTQWSDIAYLQLVHASGNNQAQVQGVKRIIQFHITNKATQDQIREALGTVAGASLASINIETGGQAAEFLATTDACRALFKTPNGNGGYFLFAQHPTQMGSKTLEKISVFTSNRNQADSEPINGEDTSVWYYMVAHFIDAPESDL